MSKSSTIYVFISYSHSDSEAASRLSSKLKAANIRHFRDKDGIAWGESIPKRVHDALQQATHLIVLISPGSEKSQWVAYEMGYGQGREAKIIPFLLHPSMNVPGFISDLRYVVAGTPEEDEFIKSLKKQSRQPITPVQNESENLTARLTSFRKLIISRNPIHREKAMVAAASIGKAALPVIHELLGHSHLEVVISAYKAAGEIRDETSVPFVISGLYPRRSSTRLQFPTAEVAASVLHGYSEDVRAAALESINDIVRPEDIKTVISGIRPEIGYRLLLRLFESKLLHEEWDGLGGISLLIQIDEESTWPLVEHQLSEGKTLYSYAAFRKVYPFVSPAHKKYLIESFLSKPSSLSGFELPSIFERIIQGGFERPWCEKQLRRLEEVGNIVYRRTTERRELTSKIAEFLTAKTGN